MAASARLQVGYVLEGSVRRAGDRLRITARLVDGITGDQVWAERYDRTLTDIFAVQDESRGIIRALEIKLLHAEREALAQPPTGNLEAYNLYLRGLFMSDVRYRPTNSHDGCSSRCELDPDFARSLAGIADCDFYLYMHCGASVDFDEVLDFAAKAAALEPTLTSALTARGLALLATGNPLNAEDAFRSALAAGPDDAQAHCVYGRACRQWGRTEEAARLFRRAADLDPGQVSFLNMLLMAYRRLGWAAEAETTASEFLARCERELALHPESTNVKFAAAAALTVLGENGRALELAEKRFGHRAR